MVSFLEHILLHNEATPFPDSVAFWELGFRKPVSKYYSATDIVLSNTLSIVFDPEVLYLLQVSMKL